ILDSEYTDHVTTRILVPKEEVAPFMKAVTEGTSGKAVMTKGYKLTSPLLDAEKEKNINDALML
ncbi:MAG: DUF1949 domain-containing protein, partial [Bacteroidaceae bacterium]|nr:DUF1949 domain-containing protein [Bacteroidaceae bacterium]